MRRAPALPREFFAFLLVLVAVSNSEGPSAAEVRAASTVIPLAQGRQTILLAAWIDDADVRLATTIDVPPGNGTFPLLVFNHGSTGRGNDPTLYRRTVLFPDIADFFVAHGYIVATPMRRGRGQSDGRYLEGLGPYG